MLNEELNKLKVHYN